MKKKFTQNEISKIAKDIVDLLTANSKQQTACATVVALSGDLGVGKTTLTQAIARELGVQENVISPTFVIMKSYTIHKSRFATLVHIDAYRLSSESELERLGWQDIIANPKNLVLLEWPERVEGIIPQDAFRVFVSHIDDTTREIEIVD